MNREEPQLSKPLVLYHQNCMDGFCAAWVAWRALEGNAEFIPVQYGQDPPPHIEGRRVYILDFSYKRPVLTEMCKKVDKLFVLDHHKTAAEDLKAFDEQPELADHWCFIEFDMNKSGGRLAWEHFFPSKPSPWLVDYTEDRDLWRWKLRDSKEISAALASLPRTFESWECHHANFDGSPLSMTTWVEQGAAILRYQAQLVESICSAATERTMDGHSILAVNTSVLFSEVAGKLAEGKPFGAAWFQRSDGKRQWSLRSAPDGVDVSEIAKKRGGGGHKHAAGFEDDMPNTVMRASCVRPEFCCASEG